MGCLLYFAFKRIRFTDEIESQTPKAARSVVETWHIVVETWRATSLQKAISFVCFNIIRKIALNVLKNDGVDYGKKRASLRTRTSRAAESATWRQGCCSTTRMRA